MWQAGGRVETGLVKSFSLHIPFKTAKALQLTRPDLPGRQFGDHNYGFSSMPFPILGCLLKH